MNKDTYTNHFNSQLEGMVELIEMNGAVAISGTGVLSPQSAKLCANFSPDNNPRTISKYYVLFTPHNVNETILLVGVYSNFTINFHQRPACYNAGMLLVACNRSEIINFITNGTKKAQLSVKISGWTPGVKDQLNPIASNNKKRYRDNTSIHISSYMDHDSTSIQSTINIIRRGHFRTMDDIHGLLDSMRLYWILYRFNKGVLEITRLSFISTSGKSIHLLCNTRYIVRPVGPTQLCRLYTPYFNTRNLHSIMSLLVFRSSTGNSGLRHGISKFLRLTENPNQIYNLDDFVALPIIVLDTITTNINIPTEKKSATSEQKNVASVQYVLNYINNNKDKLTADVYHFYTDKDAEQIVRVINRPSFKKKIIDTLNYLGIDPGKYERSLSEISKIRSKVIHGQSYDHDYIYSKSLTRTQQTVNNKDGWTEVRLGTKLGVVDIVFELIHCILAAYFGRSCSYARSSKITS